MIELEAKSFIVLFEKGTKLMSLLEMVSYAKPPNFWHKRENKGVSDALAAVVSVVKILFVVIRRY